MAELTNQTISGVTCDARGCTERIDGETLSRFPGVREYEARAVRMGWTVWAGRSRRYYCPDHGPRRGHTMRLVAGKTEEADRG